jgi:hypothetical protein
VDVTSKVRRVNIRANVGPGSGGVVRERGGTKRSETPERVTDFEGSLGSYSSPAHDGAEGGIRHSRPIGELGQTPASAGAGQADLFRIERYQEAAGGDLCLGDEFFETLDGRVLM